MIIIKKFFRIAIVMFVVFGSFTLHADTIGNVVKESGFDYSLFGMSNKLKFRFAFENKNKDDVKVIIKNEKNKIIFEDKITEQTELKRDYNLDENGKGRYKVDILVNGNAITQNHDVFVGVNPVAGEFFAFFTKEINKDRISLDIQNNMEGAYLTFADKNGTLFYSEHIKEANVNRVLRLDNLAKGVYSVKVTHQDKSFSQNYEIK